MGISELGPWLDCAIFVDRLRGLLVDTSIRDLDELGSHSSGSLGTLFRNIDNTFLVYSFVKTQLILTSTIDNIIKLLTRKNVLNRRVTSELSLDEINEGLIIIHFFLGCRHIAHTGWLFVRNTDLSGEFLLLDKVYYRAANEAAAAENEILRHG